MSELMTRCNKNERVARSRYPKGCLHSDYVIVAAAIGEKAGVQVVVAGDQAMTDCEKVIFLPEQVKSKASAWGMLMHEIGHIKHTDQAVTKKAASNALRKSIYGAIEDVREEGALQAEWPGSQALIAPAIREVFQLDEPETERKIDRKPPHLLHNYVLLRLRHDVLEQFDLGEIAEQTEAVFNEVFPEPVTTRVNALLTDVYALKNSADALKMADSILMVMKDELKKFEERQQEQQSGKGSGKTGRPSSGGGSGTSDPGASGDGEQQDGDGSENGASGNGKKDGAGQADDDTSSDPNATKQAGNGSQDNGAGSSGGNGAGSGLGSEKEAERYKALADAINASEQDVAKDVFEEVAKNLSEEASQMPYNPAGSIRYQTPELADNNAHGYDRLSLVEGEARTLSGQLVNLVQAERIARPRVLRRGQRLSGRHLHRLAVHDMRVFTKRELERHPHTAVHVVLDRSGSMDNVMTLALDSVMSLGLALETLHGVNLGVSCFPGYRGYMTRVLRHGERINSVSGRFNLGSTGGTPMGEAMLCAASDLMQTRENRKIMIVATDGAPDDPRKVEDVVQRLLATDIEVIGIGINTMSVQSLFPVWTVIHDVSELRNALFDIAQAMLLKNQAA